MADELKRTIAPAPTAINGFLSEKSGCMERNEVISRISSYFDSLIARDENGGYTWAGAPTKSALALCLGLSCETLYCYLRGYDKKGNSYTDIPSKHSGGRQIIKTTDFDLLHKAVGIIESYYEGILSSGKNPVGAIFWLKNIGGGRWIDERNERRAVDINVNIPTDTTMIAAQMGLNVEGGVIDVDVPDEGDDYNLPLFGD